MQPSDTAYPRFKTRLTQAELERFYTPTDDELAFCAKVTRLPTTQLGFIVLLKTFQAIFAHPLEYAEHSIFEGMGKNSQIIGDTDCESIQNFSLQCLYVVIYKYQKHNIL